MALLRLEQAGKCYLDGAGEVWALQQASLTLEAGEIGVLLGPSGSGKSTLLSLAGCLARPTTGLVEVAGKVVSKLPEHLPAPGALRYACAGG